MNFVEACVQNPVKVAVGVLLVSLFGLVALFRMPMQLTPEVQIPTITVTTRWPGASPGEVEREIVQEQEEQLNSVEGVVKMSSDSTDSLGTIALEFETGTNMQEALVKVNSRLQQVPEYPEDADEPVIKASSSSDSAIAWFILSARMPTEAEIKAWQEKHPTLAAEVEPVRTAHNQGLGMLRLRRLLAQKLTAFLNEHPEMASQVRPVRDLGLSPAGREALVAQHADLAEAATLSTLMPPDIDVAKQRKFVEDFIESEFERVEGVANSDVFGGEEEELQVIVDPVALAHRRLTIADVRRVLRNENLDTSAGDFAEGKRRWVVRTRGQFREPEQVEQQVLGVFNGRHVFVSHVAEVRIGYKKPDTMVRRFGVNSIAVNAQRSTGANVLEVMDGLQATLAELNDGLLKDKGLQLSQVYDETEYINSAIGLVQSNIVWGTIFTTIVLLVFLRSVRSTLVIFLSIPTSIIGTFLIMAMLGRSLNVISLAGLAFAVGMLVDNAVVVLENIMRRYHMGESPRVASIKGTQEVWGAVTISTMTTLAVFVPVVFVQQEAGQLFRDIALAVSAAVGLSLIVSAVMVPAAATRLLKPHPPGGPATPLVPARVGPLGRMAHAFVETVVAINEWIMRGWIRSIATVIALVAVTALLVVVFWPKVEYLPPGNRNLAIGLIFPPPGYNLDELTEMGQWVENELKPYWDVDPESAESKASKEPVIADWFYVASGRRVLGIRSYDEQRAGKLAEMMRAKLNGKLPGTYIHAQQMSLFEQGLGKGRAIDIEITGPHLDELVQLGGSVLAGNPEAGRAPVTVIAGQFGFDKDGQPTLIEPAQAQPIPSLDLSSPEVHVTPRRVEAAEYQISAADLGYTVNALIDGAYATDYYRGGSKIDLTIKGQDVYAQQTHDIESLPIATPTGLVVPLASIADIELRSGPEQVNRRERQRAITIQVTPPLAVPLEDAIERINAQVVQPMRADGSLDGGYKISLGGTADKLRQAWDALGFNLILALLITYLLMAALFESWTYPFIIILIVPMAAVGGLIGLFMLSAYVQWQGFPPQTLDVLTMLGFVILIGTSVNNPTLIIDQSLNHIRNEGYSRRDAILESVRNRMRPIFITTTTNIIGLIPLVLMPGAGSELYRGLGAVVLGGMGVSMLFTLILVPVSFNLTTNIHDRLMHLLGYRGEMSVDREAGEPLAAPHGAGDKHIAVDSHDEQFDDVAITAAEAHNGNGTPARNPFDDPRSELVR